MFFALAENCNHPRMLCGTFQGGLETETIMADPAWKDDLNPREEMETYVRQGYKREEALDFLISFKGLPTILVEYPFPRQALAIFRNILQ